MLLRTPRSATSALITYLNAFSDEKDTRRDADDSKQHHEQRRRKRQQIEHPHGVEPPLLHRDLERRVRHKAEVHPEERSRCDENQAPGICASKTTAKTAKWMAQTACASQYPAASKQLLNMCHLTASPHARTNNRQYNANAKLTSAELLRPTVSVVCDRLASF